MTTAQSRLAAVRYRKLDDLFDGLLALKCGLLATAPSRARLDQWLEEVAAQVTEMEMKRVSRLLCGTKTDNLEPKP